MQHTKYRLCTRLAAIVFSLLLTVAAALPAAAAMPQGYRKHRLPIITTPGKSTEYLNYYVNGKQTSLSAMTWVQDATRGKKVVSLSGNGECLRLTSEPLPLIKTTFTAWVNWEDTGADPVLLSMTSNVVDDYLTLSLHRRESDRQIDGLYLQFYHVDEPIIEWFEPVEDGVANGIPQKEWHHLALTVDGQYWRLYVDGQLCFETLLIMSWTELRANRLYIGALNDKAGQPTLKAKLSDVCLYDKAMTADEVAFALQTGENPFDSSATGTTTTGTTAPSTAPTTVPTTQPTPTTTQSAPLRVGGFPLIPLLIMGGVLVLVVLLSVLLSVGKKKGNSC